MKNLLFSLLEAGFGALFGSAETIALAAEVNPGELSERDCKRYYGILMTALLHGKDYATAITTYQEALGSYPKAAEHIHEEGLTAYYFTRQYQQGREAGSHCSDFGSFRGAYYHALCQTMTGQSGPALTGLQAYSSSMRGDRPEDFDYHLGRCLLYAPASAAERTTRSMQAVEALTRYLAAIGKDAPADLVLMRMEGLYGAGNYALCINDASQWLERNPGSGLAYLLRGKARLRLNETAGAKADFTQAVALGVSGHPTLTTADARKLLTPVARGAAGQKKASAATQTSTKAYR